MAENQFPTPLEKSGLKAFSGLSSQGNAFNCSSLEALYHVLRFLNSANIRDFVHTVLSFLFTFLCFFTFITHFRQFWGKNKHHFQNGCSISCVFHFISLRGNISCWQKRIICLLWRDAVQMESTPQRARRPADTFLWKAALDRIWKETFTRKNADATLPYSCKASLSN